MSVKVIFKDGPAVFDSKEIAEKFLADHNLVGRWYVDHMCFVDEDYPQDEQDNEQ